MSYSDINIPHGRISTPLVHKDGKISATTQGTEQGNCWFLSGVNAMCLADENQQRISDMLEYHNDGASYDGYTIVHLAMGDFKVMDEEVASVRDGFDSNKYSSGDDDMIILELAAEKALKSAGNEYAFNVNTPEYVEDLKENSDRSSVNAGNFAKAIYMLTGKASTIYKPNSIIKDGNVQIGMNGIDEAIKLYQNNNFGQKAMNAIIDGNHSVNVRDLNTNQEISLKNNHQYAIKDISDDTVSIINPWNSVEEIKISLSDFKNNFNQIEYIDLNDMNNDKNYVAKEYTTDGIHKNFKFDNPDGTSSVKTYKNGNLKSVTQYDAQNNPTSKTLYNKGKAESDIVYNSDNTRTVYSLDKTGKQTRCMSLDAQGKLMSVSDLNKSTSQWEQTDANFFDFMLARKIRALDNSNDIFKIQNNGTVEHVLSKMGANSNSVSLNDREYKQLENSNILTNENLMPNDVKTLLNLTI